MDERHELIYFKDNFPVKCFLHRLGDVPKHWHGSGELLWVMTGEVTCIVNDRVFTLKDDDIILINPDEIHELHSSGGTILATQLNYANFKLDEATTQDLYFNCNTALSTDKAAFARLKRLLSRLIKFSQSDNISSELKATSVAYDLLSELLSMFKAKRESVNKSKKYLVRLQSILSYINENYQNNLTISDVAEHAHLTVPYLSSFFEKYIGVTFTKYYTDYRLEKSVNELITSDESIESIALKHGFSEVHTFTRAFKKKYNMLPSVYRKLHIVPTTQNKNVINYLEINPENPLPLVSKYLETQSGTLDQTVGEKSLRVPIDIFTAKGTTIKRTFKKFAAVGRAKEILYSNTQTMLKQLQSDIGFEYIKFQGILSDDMLVVTRKNGKLNFSFVLVDQVIDFLLSIGLKPLIQLSFMPKALAKKPEKTLFDAPFIMSEPADINEWLLLIDTFTKHLIARYGKSTVESWLFSIWNEPDTTSAMFGLDDDNVFFTMYFDTFKAIKAIDPNIPVGSPSLLLSVPECFDFATSFLKLCGEYNCIPDFMNIHYYTDEIDTKKRADVGDMLSYPGQLSMDENKLGKFIANIRSLFNKNNVGDKPVYMTEWNMTLSHRNLINDTSFLSCYVYKNLLDNIDKLDSFGYWSLTDLIEENQPAQELFHGGLGMFTQNGIKKAVYNAYALAAKMRGELIAQGEGYMVCKDQNKIYIALYNYEHFNKAFAMGKIFDISQKTRYSPFQRKPSLSIEIPIYSLPDGNYAVKEYTVGINGGSAFDAWVKSGALPIEQDDIPYLQAAAEPNLYKQYLKSESGVLIYRSTLDFLDIKLVTIDLLII